MNAHLRWAISSVVPPYIMRRLDPTRQVPEYVVDHSCGVYGQKGEDLVIDALLGSRPVGFYVDVGANDPVELSNTKRFYDRGWHGVNIEPDPIRHSQLERARPRDLNLNVGAGPVDGRMDFFRFDIDTISTFDAGQAKRAEEEATLLGRVSVPVRRLSGVIDAYCPGTEIDFMSIDVEGFELEVLKGMDWTRHRPELVVMEISIDGGSKIKAMQEEGYRLAFSNGLNGFFVEAVGHDR